MSRFPWRTSTRKRRSGLEFGKENAKRWLQLLNDHWIGPKNNYLCGKELTIADYFGAGIVTLGELIGCDFAPYPNIQRWVSNMKKLPSWSSGNKEFYDLREMIKAQSFERI